MKKEQIIILLISFFLGMLILNMIKNVCGCDVVEGQLDSWRSSELYQRGAPGQNALGDCYDYLQSYCFPTNGIPRDGQVAMTVDGLCNINASTVCAQRPEAQYDTVIDTLLDIGDNRCSGDEEGLELFKNYVSAARELAGNPRCDAANPCQDVDCGDHGSCDGGTCTCEGGYSGTNCATLQECPLQSHRLTAEYTDTQPENWISTQCSWTNRYSSGFTRDCGEWSRSDGFSSPRVSMKIASDDNDDNTAFCCRGREGTEVADLQKCMLPQIVCPTQDQVAGGYDAVRGGHVGDLHLPDRDARRKVCGGPLGRLYGCEGDGSTLLGHMHDGDGQRFCCDGPTGAVAKCTELTAETSR